MSLETLIPLMLKLSITVLVFSLGLEATHEDALYLFRHPSELVRSLFSMYIVMPLVAIALALGFDLHPAVKIAIATLALSPVPPVLPRKQSKAGGRASYAIGLLVVAALLAIVVVPVGVEVYERVSGIPLQMSAASVAWLVLSTALIPLGAGLLVHAFAPVFAERVSGPLSKIATLLLVLSALPILFTAWRAVFSLIGNGTIAAFAAFVLIGLAVGHFLGIDETGHRSVLALSTASRHPGIAMAIATVNVPGQKLVPAAVILYLIVSAILTAPYLKWRQKVRAGSLAREREKPTIEQVNGSLKSIKH
jgi:BASS family bile acid:Na+ symporter